MEEQEDQKAQKQPEATRHHFVAGDIAKIDSSPGLVRVGVQIHRGNADMM